MGYPPPSLKGNNSHKNTASGPNAPNESSESLVNINHDSVSKLKTAVIIGTVSGISLINSMLGGIMIVSLPTMAHDINLSGSLLLWPASVNALACGCTLLFAGSISDVIGGRRIYLLGEFLLTVTTIACGVCTSGIQLILFRAAQGVAVSFCLPPSVSLITANIPTGTYRNIAFACLGAGQPIGFSVGLVLGGLLVQSIGWRYGYYIGAILTFLIFIISIFGLPKDPVEEYRSTSSMFQRIKTEIDWIGCTLLSTSLGMFSYVFSVLASGASRFIAPASLTLFSIAVVLIPLFTSHT
jgi:MFS family permease